MNKTLVTVALILAVAALVGWYMYLENNRYELVGTQKGIAYEVDRRTGTTWTVYPGSKKVHEEPSSQNADRSLLKFSDADVNKVTGNAGLSYGSFSGKLYNGSDWIVREVIFHVAAKEKEGETRWTRRFRKKVTILPLTTTDFNLNVVGDKGIGSIDWGVMEVYGNPLSNP